jgi:hypothetical protein
MIAVMDRDQITAEVAARLVAGQFPQWAGLPVVPVGLGGWDNITFRLGRELSVRLPSGQDYAAQVAKEHRWLPFLAGQLPLPVPEPVALGRPAAGFPWSWSVYRWIRLALQPTRGHQPGHRRPRPGLTGLGRAPRLSCVDDLGRACGKRRAERRRQEHWLRPSVASFRRQDAPGSSAGLCMISHRCPSGSWKYPE